MYRNGWNLQINLRILFLKLGERISLAIPMCQSLFVWSFLQPRLEQDPVEVQGSKNHGAPAPSTTAAWCWHDLCLSAQKRLPTEKFTHARCSSVYGEGYGLIFFVLCIVYIYIYEICICTCIEMPHLFLHKNRSFWIKRSPSLEHTKVGAWFRNK